MSFIAEGPAGPLSQLLQFFPVTFDLMRFQDFPRETCLFQHT